MNGLTLADLLEKKCRTQVDALSPAQVIPLLSVLQDWHQDGQSIIKTYRFKNYYETLAYVNAIAYVFHTENHHPRLELTYNTCTVQLDTHSVNQGKGGLSESDFICAAKIDSIYQQSQP